MDGFFLAAEENTTPPARRTADRPVRQARSIAIASRELLPRVARGSAQRRLGHLRHSSVLPVAFTPSRLVPERRRGPEPFVRSFILARSNRRNGNFLPNIPRDNERESTELDERGYPRDSSVVSLQSLCNFKEPLEPFSVESPRFAE